MALFHLTKSSLAPIPTTSFGVHGFKERGDLQRLLRSNIAAVAEDVLVIAEEFADWEDSHRRIDLLGIDRQANLVVIELKRDDDGHMELQAVRYAAMVRSMTFARAAEAYADYLKAHGSAENAGEKLLAHLGWDEPREDDFAQEVRIVLVARDFSKELTTAVLWLNEYGLDIRCVRIHPYALNGEVIIDSQQVIPLPETEAYTVKIKNKEQAVRQEKAERHTTRKEFWSELIPLAAKSTPRFASITPGEDHWLAASSGVPGFYYHYLIWQQTCGVKIYIDQGPGSEAANNAAFDSLHSNRSAIEAAYGGVLVWDRNEGRRACAVYDDTIAGGIKSPRDQWPDMREQLVNAMQRFERAIGPHLAAAANAGRAAH